MVPFLHNYWWNETCHLLAYGPSKRNKRAELMVFYTCIVDHIFVEMNTLNRDSVAGFASALVKITPSFQPPSTMQESKEKEGMGKKMSE